MIGEVSEFYKEMGFTRLYIVINKEPRRVAILYKDDGSSLTMSYAKYLYTSHYKELIDGHEYHIDHINNNKMDDRIENLQKITGSYNRSKDHTTMNTIVEIIEKIKAEVNRQKSYYYYINNSYNKKAVRVCNNLLSVLGYLEKEERSKNSTDQEQPVKTNIVEDLKHYLSTTPKEQIKKDWESLKEWDKIGPSVSEFLGWKQPVCEKLGKEMDRFFTSEEYEKAKKAGFGEAHAARHFAKWGAEHRGSSETPKDLEEAAEISFDEARALTEGYIYFLAKGLEENQPRPIGPHWFCEYAKNRFIAGAKWQAEQDQGTIELAEDHAYLAGAVNEREKMMKEAVEGKIRPLDEEIWVEKDSLKGFEDGDKVRIIIVKEDTK